MQELTQLLDYTFRKESLLDQSLTHPSFAFEKNVSGQDNQRLEFLGDAVLQLIVTETLYERFPQFSEGDLTKLRSHLVSSRSLEKIARRMNLGSFLKLGKGEERSGGQQRASNLVDVIESILGAVYLDGGYEAAKHVVYHLFEEDFEEAQRSPVDLNPKGELQEILQAIYPESPIYEVVSEGSQPSTDGLFHIQVRWKGCLLGDGYGSNKKSAEAHAAQVALDKRLWESPPPLR